MLNVPVAPAMLRSGILVALSAAACGQVGGAGPADGAVDTSTPPDSAPPRMFRGAMDEVPAVTFGGAPACTYHITLKQLEITLTLAPSGQVTMGHVQDLNVESVVVSTTPNCPADYGVIEPNIASYTLQSAQPNDTTTTLTFKGGPTNKPPADLTVELSSVGSAYQARLGFHRNELGPPFDWSVIVMLPLSEQLSEQLSE